MSFSAIWRYNGFDTSLYEVSTKIRDSIQLNKHYVYVKSAVKYAIIVELRVNGKNRNNQCFLSIIVWIKTWRGLARLKI